LLHADAATQADPLALLAQLQDYLTNKLSWWGSPAITRKWPEISGARLDEALAEMFPEDATYRLRTRHIIVGEREVDRVPLLPGEVPVVESVQIRERPFRPHFSIVIDPKRAPAPDGELERRVRELLSGLGSTPVTQGWGEITIAQVRSL